jgi:hypothetical protein
LAIGNKVSTLLALRSEDHACLRKTKTRRQTAAKGDVSRTIFKAEDAESIIEKATDRAIFASRLRLGKYRKRQIFDHLDVLQAGHRTARIRLLQILVDHDQALGKLASSREFLSQRV